MEKLIKIIFDKYAIRMNLIRERSDFHPELSLFLHIITVIDNVAKYNDNDLTISALFHDIGKVYTYEKYNNSYGHELTSAWLVLEYRDQIEKAGGNVDKIHWIVQNHLKAGHIINGKKNKNDYILTEHEWWKDINKFANADNMLDDEDKVLDYFLNKKVYVTDNNDVLTGICTFIGYNKFLKCKQITIDRSPIRLKNYNLICTYYNPMSI